MRKIFLIILLLTLTPVFFARAETPPIKILLVPGHDDEVWGAQYGNMKEADMTLSLAKRIYNLLKADKRFEAYITRDSAGYTKEFADYFSAQASAIVAFKDNAKKLMQGQISLGSFIQKVNVPHHNVSESVADKLYGINKWADENQMNAVIHIHFNDYPRPNKWTIGQYTGFAVYFPDGEMNNFRESANLAADIYTQLRKKYKTSTYPPEVGGLIPDQKLIAVGANDTLDANVRSVLVEYGYIYEKKFRSSAARLTAYKNMAAATATGIENYFFSK